MNGNHSGANVWRRLQRRRFLQGSIAIAAGSAAAFLLACGDSKQDEAQDTSSSPGAAAGTAAQTPRRGGRLLQLLASSTNSLNVVANFNEGFVLGGVHVYDRLISQRPTNDTAKEYVPEAAQSVEQPDPTTVIFRLKPGMTYHDKPPVNGRAVAADDIVKTQLFVRDNPRSQNPTFQTVSMQNVEAPDTQTVVFTLKAPNAYLFSDTQLASPSAQCIIPAETLDNLDTGWQVGSGPYELAEYELNVRYRYTRFAGFREAGKGLPYIDEREWRVIVDPAAAESAFRSEQAQIWTVPLPRIADQVKKDLGGRIDMDEYLSLALVTLSANGTKPPWNDVRAREALYRLINRQQYLDLLDEGRGEVPRGTLPAGLTDYQLDPKQTERYFKQDPKAARQLLEAAGYDFNREVEMSAINLPRNNQGMEIFQEQASQAGIKVQITPMPFAEWLQQKVFVGNWEAWYGGFPAYDSPHWPMRLQHTNTLTPHRYNGLKDPGLDAMIEKAEVTIDRNEHVKLVKEIQIALLEQYTPFIVTHGYTAYIARWKYVRDYELNPTAQPMYRTEMWLDQA